MSSASLWLKRIGKSVDFRRFSRHENRSTVTACVAVLYSLFFYALILFYPGRKERMDIRSRRRCGNVHNWPYYGAVENGVYRMWESSSFSMCCECVFHRWNGLLCTFPRCYPRSWFFSFSSFGGTDKSWSTFRLMVSSSFA